MRNIFKTLIWIGGGVLLAVAILHASGFTYINRLVASSDTPGLIKNIFPVLYIVPSIQLVGIAIIAVLSIYLKNKARFILIPISVLIIINACLAFYLGALIPGFVLLLPALLFGITSVKSS